jgi:hypothetical protein
MCGSEAAKHPFPEAEPMGWREGNTHEDGMQVITRSGGVRELGMCGHSLRGNRETSERSL